ncbi:MAG: MFS transporter, partial [SAR202 cluster bacterium]|nr:MFS transporter [SAR202 cluster bacterium]
MNVIDQVTGLPNRARGVFYGWWLVGVSGFVMVISTTPMFHAMGLWFVALESAFGWNRTQLSVAFALTRVEGGILGPIEGYLVDRLGTRRLVFIGLTIMGIGMLMLGQTRALWMFYIAYLVMALGQGLGSWLPLMTLLNNWFDKNRAMAMGWSNSISRAGSLLLIPAIAWSIDPEADRLGFRLTATIIGLTLIVLAFPLSRLIRNRPEEYGLLPDGATPTQTQGANGAKRDAENSQTKDASEIGFTVKQALRTRAFWFISIGHGFTSMVLIAMMAHLAPMLTDRGHSIQTAAFVVTVYTATSMFFQLVGGYAGDRVPKRFALFVFTSIQAIAVFILTFGPETLFISYAFAVLFGIGFGGRNPLTVSIRGEYFGRRSFGKIMGVSQVPMNVLLFLAPTMAGIMRDVQGNYTMAFGILAV